MAEIDHRLANIFIFFVFDTFFAGKRCRFGAKIVMPSFSKTLFTNLSVAKFGWFLVARFAISDHDQFIFTITRRIAAKSLINFEAASAFFTAADVSPG